VRQLQALFCVMQYILITKDSGRHSKTLSCFFRRDSQWANMNRCAPYKITIQRE